LDSGAYYGREALRPLILDYDNAILDAVSRLTLLATALVVFLVGMIRDCPLVALIAIIGQLGAVIGAEILKRVLPWHALILADAYWSADLQRDSYPSGHTTIGTSVALVLILVSPARWRLWLAPFAGFLSASFATAVFFAGWHRASDALGGIVWPGLCMSLAAVAALLARGRILPRIKQSPGPLITSAALATVVIALSWLAAVGGRPEYPNADPPLLILTFLIIAASFSLISWFAWQLRGVDWSEASSQQS
jgi:hypothetical protein